MLWPTEREQGPQPEADGAQEGDAKQHLNLRCGGSTQPYHAVIDTPGPGWMIRCNSKKYLEDGLFEIAVGPYGETDDSGGSVTMGGFGR